MFRKLIFVIIVNNVFSDNMKLHLAIEENLEMNNNPIGNLLQMIKNQTEFGTDQTIKRFQLDDPKSRNFQTRRYIQVTPSSGDIFLKATIDREDICQRMFQCNQDKTFLDYLVFADNNVYELRLEIRDVNDNYPSFMSDEKVIKIPEGIEKMVSYSLPSAKDKDSTQFGVKRYEIRPISNQNYKRYFRLKNATAKLPHLLVIDKLDRESIPRFEFNLYVVDGGAHTGMCKIVIEVSDTNDNFPQWVGLPYRRNLRECTSEELVIKLMAEDKDDPLTDGGQVEFRISENTDNFDQISQVFFISNKALHLNKDALQSLGRNRVSIIVIASDRGGRRNETTVQLDITDCNDHSPQIEMDQRDLQVRENDGTQHEIIKIRVTDNDRDQNSNFQCVLNDSKYLRLVEKRSIVSEFDGSMIRLYSLETVGGGVSFDRELVPRISVELQCTDAGQPPMSSTERITVYVLDENDNAPQFEDAVPDPRQFQVAEDAQRHSIVGHVMARDVDAVPHNTVIYSLLGGGEDVTKTFIVGGSGEIQLIGKLDRETQDHYEFQILAANKDNPDMNDTCQIQVIVLDVNDCTPEIDSLFRFKMVESYDQKSSYSSLEKLNASDRDSGLNGSFYFKLFDYYESSPLGERMSQSLRRGIGRIDGGRRRDLIKVMEDGRMSVYGVVDREKMESLSVVILIFCSIISKDNECAVDQVIDRGVPARTATTTVIIEILDLNDNIPQLLNFRTQINVSVDTPIGSTVTQLTASDLDKGNNGTVTFSILRAVTTVSPSSDNPTNHPTYVINEKGHLVLNRKLGDQSSQVHLQSQLLLIKVKDLGTPPLEKIVNLFIRYYTKKSSSSLAIGSRSNSGSGDRGRGRDSGNSNYLGGGISTGNDEGSRSRYDKTYNSNSGNTNNRTKWADSKSLLAVLVCVIMVVVIVFTVVVFFYIRHVCLQKQNVQTTKQMVPRDSVAATSVSGGVRDPNNPTYQKTNTKMNQGKSDPSLNDFNTYHIERGFSPRDPQSTNYTNLTWLKNDFYEHMDMSPKYGGPTNCGTPLLSVSEMAGASGSYSAFQPNPQQQQQPQQPQQYDMEVMISESGKSPEFMLGWLQQQQQQQLPGRRSKTYSTSSGSQLVLEPHGKTFSPSQARHRSPQTVPSDLSVNSVTTLPTTVPSAGYSKLNQSDSGHSIKVNYVTSSFV